MPRGVKLGHFAPERWVRGQDSVHELFVGAGGLARGGQPYWVATNLTSVLARRRNDATAPDRAHRPGNLLLQRALRLARDEHAGIRLTAANRKLAEQLYLPAGLIYERPRAAGRPVPQDAPAGAARTRRRGGGERVPMTEPAAPAGRVPEAPGLTLAQKLNLLVDLHPRGQRPPSNEDIAAAISARGGTTISPAYLWLLRSGKRDNPTKKHTSKPSRLFGVAPAYFFEDDRRTTDDLLLAAATRDQRVRRIAQLAAGLSPALRDAILGLIEAAQVRTKDLSGEAG